MNSIPSKAEQIEAIIHSTTYQLTMRYAGRDESGIPKYSKVFTVTRKEIEEYVRTHYRLNNLPMVNVTPESHDGLHIIRVPEGYHIYYQERNIRDTDYIVPSEDDVWKFYIDFKIRYGGGPDIQE